MREIKFRIWDIDRQMYLTEEKCYKENICAEGEKIHSIGGIWIALDGTVYYDWHDGYELQNQEANAIVEQNTGLKDKNGIEIYDGDTVILDLNNLGYKKGIVKWHNECASWVFDNPKDNYFTIDIFYSCDNIEVIGNIHDGDLNE